MAEKIKFQNSDSVFCGCLFAVFNMVKENLESFVHENIFLIKNHD